MTIKKIYEKLDDFTVDERAEQLKQLKKLFTPLSIEQLKQFEIKIMSDTTLNFEDFVKEQNAEIRICINLEVSEMMGAPIRKFLNLPKITMKTEV